MTWTDVSDGHKQYIIWNLEWQEFILVKFLENIIQRTGTIWFRETQDRKDEAGIELPETHTFFNENWNDNHNLPTRIIRHNVIVSAVKGPEDVTLIPKHVAKINLKFSKFFEGFDYHIKGWDFDKMSHKIHKTSATLYYCSISAWQTLGLHLK